MRIRRASGLARCTCAKRMHSDRRAGDLLAPERPRQIRRRELLRTSSGRVPLSRCDEFRWPTRRLPVVRQWSVCYATPSVARPSRDTTGARIRPGEDRDLSGGAGRLPPFARPAPEPQSSRQARRPPAATRAARRFGHGGGVRASACEPRRRGRGGGGGIGIARAPCAGDSAPDLASRALAYARDQPARGLDGRSGCDRIDTMPRRAAHVAGVLVGGAAGSGRARQLPDWRGPGIWRG